jgi:nucleotide-binding universal stress UspA family protein
MIKKILLPTDGSDHAAKAFDYAADFALKYNAEIHFIHVLQELKVPEGLDEFIQTERIQDIPRQRIVLQKMGDAIIQSLEGKAKERSLEHVKSAVLLGDPAEKIIEYATDKGIDLIVMGSRGLGAVKMLFMGSVSNKVCNLAVCPCVTVK